MLDTGLAGKVVIVTGANHGIGAAIAAAFANQRAKVLIHYYRAGAEAYGDLSEEDAEKVLTCDGFRIIAARLSISST